MHVTTFQIECTPIIYVALKSSFNYHRHRIKNISKYLHHQNCVTVDIYVGRDLKKQDNLETF